MRLPLPQLTTILLLTHLGFGCCFHHAHACETNCCSEPTASADACACDTHRDDDSAEHSKRGDDSDPHRCVGDHCTFLSGQSSPGQITEFAVAVSPLKFVVAVIDVDVFRSHLDRSLDQRLSIAGLSLRTHLALRVLLV